MSILDEQLKNDKLASTYIFEGKNPSSNKEFALDFAKNVFTSYKVASDIENNPDLYVLDKEGDVIDIQSIRNILKDVYLRPDNGKIKIYIIHNAQDMRDVGANAMLKSLEELKPYVKIIFTCVNRDSIIPTIRSRCQIISIKTSDIDLSVDKDKLYRIIADVYSGKIEAYYKEKDFFSKFKDDRSKIINAMLNLFQNLIKYKYSGMTLPSNEAYLMRKFDKMNLDSIEKIISLLEDIKTAYRTNINYDLSIEKMIFTIYREGKHWLKVVGVRFRQAGKIYYFDSCGIDFDYKDLAVVETSNGVEIAEVALTDVDVDEDNFKEKLLPVIRKATIDDIYYHKKNEQDAKAAIDVCQQKSEEHGLNMKIIDAKFTFDRSKITFYFKSDKRVDFRSLVKDLAAIYRNRIELRQVGVRDHAKMIEHYGPCGQKCCCGRFLNDFKPLSIKMAKDQDITLDPSKISGICGRLMCCLSYEEECYKQAKNNMPKEGQKVNTCDGVGMVLDNDYVRECCKVRVKLKDSDSNEEIEKSYSNDELEY